MSAVLSEVGVVEPAWVGFRGGPQRVGGDKRLLCGPRPSPASVYHPALAVHTLLGSPPRQIPYLTCEDKVRGGGVRDRARCYCTKLVSHSQIRKPFKIISFH